MPQITASFGDSLSRFDRHIKKYGTDVKEEIFAAIDKQATLLFNQLKGLTRKDTGKLRNGWRKVRMASSRSVRYNISNEVSYGVYTTSNRTPSRGGEYLGDLVERLIDQHKKRLQVKINKILNDAARKFNS